LSGYDGEGLTAWRARYYEGGISSVYFWDVDDGFAGCVLLKKCKCGGLWRRRDERAGD
jgi:hypothetical protein